MTDDEMIAAAIVKAREAGVPNREIAGVLRASRREPQDELTAPVLAGRLLALARLTALDGSTAES